MSRIFDDKVVHLKTNAFAVKFMHQNPIIYKYNLKVLPTDPIPTLGREDLEEGELSDTSSQRSQEYRDGDKRDDSFIIRDFFAQKLSNKEFKSRGTPVNVSLDTESCSLFSPQKLDRCISGDLLNDNENLIVSEKWIWTPSGKRDSRSVRVEMIFSSSLEIKKSKLEHDTILKGLETIMRHKLKQNMLTCGQYFYQHRSIEGINRVTLDSTSEIATGIFLSGVKFTLSGPIVVIDHCRSIISKEGNLSKLLHDHVTSTSASTSSQKRTRITIRSLKDVGQNDDNLVEFLKNIVKRRCQIDYLGYKKKITVTGYSSKSARQIKFYWTDAKQEISIEEYFQRRYSIRLKFPNLPCLIAGKENRPVYYPIEVCALLGDERIPLTQLSSDLVQNISRFGKESDPNARYNDCIQAVQEFENLSHDHLRGYNIELNTEPLVVKGRLAIVPRIMYGRNYQTTPKNGRWMPKQFFNAQTLSTWFVINTSATRSMEDIENFINALIDYALKFFGLKISSPRYLDYSNTKIPAEEIATVAARKCLSSVKGKIHSDQRGEIIELILFIIDDKRSLYPSIHYACDVVHGIRATCLQAKNTRQNRGAPPGGSNYNAAIMKTLIHKFNTRLGGVNNIVNARNSLQLSDLLPPRTMFIGCDVSHSDSSSENSIAACVASMDECFFQYAPAVQVQPRINEEMIVMIDEMIEMLLREYESRNKRLPSVIVVFRDGVSTNQFEMVKELEIAKIDRVLRKIYLDERSLQMPRLVFIVVQKRHRLRLFYEHSRSLTNPPPGTVVDDVVTSEKNVEFYLISHFNDKGTSRPAHYYILRNDSVMSARTIQHLSFMLCHSYARCPSSISIPAPVMYAHLAAYRMRILLIGSRQLSKWYEIHPQSQQPSTSGSSIGSRVEIASCLRNTMYFC